MVAHKELRAWLDGTKSKGMALGLANTQRALEELQLSHPSYETVHVAGSNGKGTAVAMLSAALSTVDVDHLAFTSPHLVRVEERIRLNGRPVSSQRFDEGLRRVHDMVQRSGIQLTFFEVTFLVAMVVAELASISVLLLETGLGGRLDATRVAPADVALVTALSLEHTEVLGNTLEAIAGEKAAIARPRRPLVVRAVSEPAVKQRIEEAAREAGVPDVDQATGAAHLEWVDVPLDETYFNEAKALAAAVWKHLTCAETNEFPKFRGLKWPGRMQDVPSPTRSEMSYLLEGAHNPSGMEASCALLEPQTRWSDPWLLLLGCTPQTDLRLMLHPLMDMCKRHAPVAVVLTEPQFGRYPGVPCDDIEAVLVDHGVRATAKFSQPEMAVNWIESETHGARTVLCIGSLYLQGNVLSALNADSDEGLAIVAKE